MSGERQREPLDEDAILLKVEGTPPCPRCGGGTALLAQYQYSWRNNHGEHVTGVREAVLCRGCDRADPEAAELLALFAVDDHVDDHVNGHVDGHVNGHVDVLPENLAGFGGLVAAWVESVRQRSVDMMLLDDRRSAYPGSHDRNTPGGP